MGRPAVAAGFGAALVVPILFIVLWDGFYLMREGAYLLSLMVRTTIALLGRVRSGADDPRGYIRDVLLPEVAPVQ